MTPDELVARTKRFYDRYSGDLEQIRQLLDIRLSQLALAYTIQNKLPSEAITVRSRVKSFKSFVGKLEKKGWPQFYYPTEIIKDLIGARVICWFVDDCDRILNFIQSSNHIDIHEEVEDYIKNPKPSGYRSVHLLADIEYDAVRRSDAGVVVANDRMTCEIQIRTKLQDAWGDLTHEFHYKAINAGVQNTMYESILSEISQRLASEDRSLIVLRDAYQRLADEKMLEQTREGFRDG